jgi:hypothetical protein
LIEENLKVRGPLIIEEYKVSLEADAIVKKVLLEDGSTYYGFVDHYNEPHGAGQRLYKSGMYVDGNWEVGQIDTRGRMFSATGDFYTGQMKRTELHGKGEYFYYATKITFTGRFY